MLYEDLAIGDNLSELSGHKNSYHGRNSHQHQGSRFNFNSESWMEPQPLDLEIFSLPDYTVSAPLLIHTQIN